MEKNIKDIDTNRLTKTCVSGVVVLYNSDRKVINNINSYINQIDHLYVIDNSDYLNKNIYDTLNKIPNLTYIPNEINQGIAYALNQAANLAISAGYKYLLTMDDDTSLAENSIDSMLSYINNNNKANNYGIIAGQSDPKKYGRLVTRVFYTITSGNLLNLSAYKTCGPFMNDLFIDFVDHEYCFRLSKYGYEIIELNYIRLNHRLGTYKKKNFILFRICWNSHNPNRIYYKTRNAIYVLRKYSYLPFQIRYVFYKDFLKDILKLFFLENEKLTRIKLICKAIKDANNVILGKLI